MGDGFEWNKAIQEIHCNEKLYDDKLKEMINQNTELKARVLELEDFLVEIIDPVRECGCCPCHGRCHSDTTDLEYIKDRAEELLQ